LRVHAETQTERPAVANLYSDLGRIKPDVPVKLTVHLNMQDQDGFDQAVKLLYTPGSPTYHRWMTKSDFARWAPTAAQLQIVTGALQSHGLSVLAVSPDNLSIRVTGPAAAVESAFQTQLHQFKSKDKVFHANVTPAKLAGAAGSLVRGVTGLTNVPVNKKLAYQINPLTGERLGPSQGSNNGFSAIATNNCFGAPSSVLLRSGTAPLPYGVYSGNTYHSYDPSTGSPWCSWTPSQIQAHYGLTEAYARGLDGTGQTIVIVDGPTDGAELQSDLALFSSLAGLPAITSSNFTVLYPDGQPTASELPSDWQGEASLDAEWVHSIAPGANIVVLIMPVDEFDEYELAIDYARVNQLGNVVSNSYGWFEATLAADAVQGFESVLENAAAAGIAVNFATGDSGDNTSFGATGGFSAAYPATSAYVTAVGGTSIGIPDGTPNGAEVGWGNNETVLSQAIGGAETDGVLDPPKLLGNVQGSGGGVSSFIGKPSWQSSLPGTARQTPDIAALGDPATGVVYVLNGAASGGLGGTSLSCPIFSALWAIADQAAGAPLGQAAPLLYSLPTTAIKDVVPLLSNPYTNVAGFVVDSNGSTQYSAAALLGPLYTTTQYYSVMYGITFQADYGAGIVNVGVYAILSFSTDTSLTVTPGWDNMTGLGVPNGLAFINAAAGINAVAGTK
jgi:subtilase family serine protease